VAKYYICTESKADGGEYTNTQGKKNNLSQFVITILLMKKRWLMLIAVAPTPPPV
jgi:hypothetical protein